MDFYIYDLNDVMNVGMYKYVILVHTGSRGLILVVSPEIIIMIIEFCFCFFCFFLGDLVG